MTVYTNIEWTEYACQPNTCYLHVDCTALDPGCPGEDLFFVPIKELQLHPVTISIVQVSSIGYDAKERHWIHHITLAVYHSVALFVEFVCSTIPGHFNTSGRVLRPGHMTIMFASIQDVNSSIIKENFHVRYVRPVPQSPLLHRIE